MLNWNRLNEQYVNVIYQGHDSCIVTNLIDIVNVRYSAVVHWKQESFGSLLLEHSYNGSYLASSYVG